MTKSIVSTRGKNSVKIESDSLGDVQLATTQNGYQWSAARMNEELLVMTRELINVWLDEAAKENQK